MSDSVSASIPPEDWVEPVLWPSTTWGLAISGLVFLLGILWLWRVPHSRMPTSVPIIADAHELQPHRGVSATAPILSGISCVSITEDTHEVPLNTSGACPPQTIWRGQFQFTGRHLWFKLKRGDLPGYLTVAVAGQPASELNRLLSFQLTSGEKAGYLPLLSPYEHAYMRPEQEWFLVHKAPGSGPHHVIYEIVADRAIGKGDFIQAAGVDLVSIPGWSRSPGLLLSLGGLLGIVVQLLSISLWPRILQVPVNATVVIRQIWCRHIPGSMLIQSVWVTCGLILVSAGIREHSWWLSLPGVLCLGLLGLRRPAWWLGSVLLGLPFYLHPIPLLPGFALNLVEIGVWGGAGLALLHSIRSPSVDVPTTQSQRVQTILLLLLLIALFSAVESSYPLQAFREWRTVFLAGFVFLLALVSVLQHSNQRDQDVGILLTMWLAGAVVIALYGYYSYWVGTNITDVEGVRRIRGMYGSPNNLALYLERTVLVCLTLFIFAASWRRRLLWGLALVIQGGAILLTFSKGALLLGLPTGMLVVLYITVRQASRWPGTRRPLWLLIGVALIGFLLLIPFLRTPRFDGLLNVRQSFPNLVRLHLWRSGLHMFLDHWFLGVGPDNFLYLYRSFYLAPAVWNEPSLNHPHNIFVDLLSRLGILGFLGGIVFVVTGLRQLYGRIVDIQPNMPALGCLAAVVAGITHGQVDASFALPDIMLVWVFLFGIWCFPYPVQGPDPLLN